MLPSSDPGIDPLRADSPNVLYLIRCRSRTESYVKIGRTCSLRRRLSNIQTGCPHPIDVAFVITSEYPEEVVGLERLLHKMLRPHRMRAEWYLVSQEFLRALDALLRKVNRGGFSFDEINDMPDYCGPELEIMLHRHEFGFSRLALPFRPNLLKGAKSVSWKGLAAELTGAT
jgi:hypothetical protein